MAKKLYELLVVEGQLKAQAQKTRTDLQATFDKKKHLFGEKRTTFTPIEAGTEPTVEEQSDIQTNVPHELRWLAGLWTPALDTSFQVAHGNALAKADIVLDSGAVLLSDVPATALLELEKRAAEIQSVIETAPTLDPAKGFRPDADRGRFIFKAREVTKTRTKKIEKHLVVVPPTEQHPAQVVKTTEDIVTGTIREQEWSGMITPARKSDLLARVEELRRAVKTALHRANAVELIELPTCGQKIFDFVLAD